MNRLRLALDVGIRRLGRFIRLVLHAVLQSANPLADALAKFGQLLWTKHQQSDEEDHQQMHGLEKTFKHKNLLSPRRQLSTLPEASHIRQFPTIGAYIIDTPGFYVTSDPAWARTAATDSEAWLEVSCAGPARFHLGAARRARARAQPNNCGLIGTGAIILKTLQSVQVHFQVGQ